MRPAKQRAGGCAAERPPRREGPMMSIMTCGSRLCTCGRASRRADDARPVAQTAIPAIDEAARARGIEKLYYFDPVLAGE